MPSENLKRQVGERLRRLRIAHGYTSSGEWADNIKAVRTTWLEYEAGRSLLAVSEAIRLCEQFGVTLDWLYRGVEHTLPGHIVEKIRATPDKLPPPRKSTRIRDA